MMHGVLRADGDDHCSVSLKDYAMTIVYWQHD